MHFLFLEVLPPCFWIFRLFIYHFTLLSYFPFLYYFSLLPGRFLQLELPSFYWIFLFMFTIRKVLQLFLVLNWLFYIYDTLFHRSNFTDKENWSSGRLCCQSLHSSLTEQRKEPRKNNLKVKLFSSYSYPFLKTELCESKITNKTN